MKIWVDSDACPMAVRDVISRAAHKRGIATVFVANSVVAIPESPWLTFVQVAKGSDVADQYIVDAVVGGDLVITQDIPLAALVVPKGAIALTPRGQLYTEDNINDALASRDLMSTLRDTGTISGGSRPFDDAARRQFANQFHNVLQRLGG